MSHLKKELVERNNAEIGLQKEIWRKFEWTKQAGFRAK